VYDGFTHNSSYLYDSILSMSILSMSMYHHPYPSLLSVSIVRSRTQDDYAYQDYYNMEILSIQINLLLSNIDSVSSIAKFLPPP
jgi:hypothetical protein